MAITVNGREYRTLAQDLFVNGAKVYEAWCNGEKVYPESDDLYLRLIGAGSMMYKQSFKFYEYDKLDYHWWYIDYEGQKRIEAYIPYNVISDFDVTVRFKKAGAGRPTWERVNVGVSEADMSPTLGALVPWTSGVKVSGSYKFEIVDGTFGQTVIPMHNRNGEMSGITENTGLWVVRTTYKPTQTCTMFNGIFRHTDDDDSNIIFSTKHDAISNLQKPKYLTMSMNGERYSTDDINSGASFLITDRNIGSEATHSTEEPVEGPSITISGVKSHVYEVYEVRRLELVIMGGIETSYSTQSRLIEHFNRIDDVYEVVGA